MSRRRILQDTDSEDDDDVPVGGGGGSGNVTIGNTATAATINGPRELLSLTPQEIALLANCHIRPSRSDGYLSSDALQEALNKLLSQDNVLERLEDEDISVLPSGNSNNYGSSSGGGHAEYQKYGLVKESTERFFSRRVFYHPPKDADADTNNDNEEGPTEEALLVEITLLHNSKKGVKSGLFRKGAGKIVFGPWWNYALERVATLSTAPGAHGANGSANDASSTSGETDPNKQFTAILLLRALFQFLRLGLAQVVREGKLPSLKKSFGVDWIECVSRAKKVVDVYCRSSNTDSTTNGAFREVAKELDLMVEHVEKLGGVIGAPGTTNVMNSASNSNAVNNNSINKNTADPTNSKPPTTVSASATKTTAPATTEFPDSEAEAKKRKEEASRARLDALKARSRRAAGIRRAGSSDHVPHSAGAVSGGGGASLHSSSAAPPRGASQGGPPASSSSSVFASMASGIGSGGAVRNRASSSGPSSSANRGRGEGGGEGLLSNPTSTVAGRKNDTVHSSLHAEGASRSNHGSDHAGHGGNYHTRRPPNASKGPTRAAAASSSSSSRPTDPNAPSRDEGWGRLRDGTQPNSIKTKGSWPARQVLSAIQLTPSPSPRDDTNDNARPNEDSSQHRNELDDRHNNFDNPNRNDTRDDYRRHPSRDTESNMPSNSDRHPSHESGGTTRSNVMPPNSNREGMATMRRDNPPVLSDGYHGGQPPSERSVGVSGRNVNSSIGGYGASVSGSGRDPFSSSSRYEEDRSEKLNRPSFREQDGGDRGDDHRGGSSGDRGGGEGRRYEREGSSYSRSDSAGNYSRDGERATFSRRENDRSRSDGDVFGSVRYDHRSSGGSGGGIRRHDNEQSSSLRFTPPNSEREDGELPPAKRFRHTNCGGDDRGSSSSNTSNPSAGAHGSGGAGRGRGRGRDVNLPAWMTRQGSGLGNNNDNDICNSDGPSGTSEVPNANPRSFQAVSSNGPTGMSNALASMNGSGRGRGRGRGVNLPAWMSRQDGNAGASNSNSDSGRPSGVSCDTANPTMDSVSGGKFHMPPAPAPAPIIPPNNGGGRGRGRGVNLPAWMTRQQDGSGNDNANIGSVGSSAGGGRGRGRGRGKDINKPAWMTRGQS